MDTDTNGRLLKSGEWRQYVIDQARTWKGTPYYHTGRVKGVGVDCGGLLYELYSAFFVLKPFPRDYPQDWALHRPNEIYLSFVAPYVTEVPTPQPGGFGLFQIARNFAHAAIVAEEAKTFIHAWGRNGSGCVIESQRRFFRIGKSEKERQVKWFDVKPELL